MGGEEGKIGEGSEGVEAVGSAKSNIDGVCGWTRKGRKDRCRVSSGLMKAGVGPLDVEAAPMPSGIFAQKMRRDRPVRCSRATTYDFVVLQLSYLYA